MGAGPTHAERHLSRQRTELFTTSQSLLGVAGVATSNTIEVEGDNSVQVTARSNATFTARVFQSIDGTNWMLADIESSVVDAITGEQVVQMSASIESKFARVTYTNTGVARKSVV